MVRRPPASYNFADVWEMAADALGDRQALVVGDAAPHLRRARGAGQPPRPPPRSAQGVAPGEHVGLYLENCPEYLEAMLACFKIRAVPINVNYRYVAGELRVPARQQRRRRRAPRPAARARCSPRSCPTSTAVRVDARAPAAPTRRPLGGRVARPPAVAAIGATTTTTSSTPAAPPACPRAWCGARATPSSPASAAATRCGCRARCTSPAELPERIGDGITYLPLAPLMHAAAQWTSFMWFFCGGKVVLMQGSLDPARVWRTIAERGRATSLTVVGRRRGQAAARRVGRHARGRAARRLSSLFSISNGGAPMSTGLQGAHPRPRSRT